MIQFQTLELQNFWSFGRTPITIDFQRNTNIHRINGYNYDVDENGNASNGSGKTAIFLGVIYALYGQGIDNILSNGFINGINGKNMKVSFSFQKNQNHYLIQRGRKPNFLQVYKNDNDITRDSVKNTESMIEELIGVPYDIFVNTFFLNTNSQPFMAMKPKEQQNFLEKILSLDTLTVRADSLKEKRKSVKSEIETTNRLLEQLQNQNQSIQQQIDREKTQSEKFDKSRKEKIDSLKEQLNELQKVDIEKEHSIEKQIQEIDQFLGSGIERTYYQEKETYNNIKNQYSKHCDLIQRKEKLEKEKEDWLEKIKKDQKELQKYVENEYSLDQLHRQKELLKELNRSLENISNIEKNVEKDNLEKDQLENEINQFQKEIDSLKEGICPYCQQQHYDESKVNELLQNIESYQSSVDHKNQVIEEHIKEIENEEEKIYQSIEPNLIFSEVEEVEKRIEQLNNTFNKIEQLNNNEDPYQKQIQEIEESIQTDFDYDAQLKEQQEKIQEVERQIEDKKKERENLLQQKAINDVSEFKNKISLLEQEIQNKENEFNPHKNRIETLNEQLQDTSEYEQQLNQLNNDLNHINLLIKMLTDSKGFIRRNILDKYIPFLNQRINAILQDIDLPHFIKIYNDLTVEIEHLGKTISYGNLSMGQKFRLNFATSLAFKELLTNMGKGIDWLGVDEYFDSNLDQKGVIRMLEIIKNHSNNIYIITHKEGFDEYFDEELSVIYKNGFSDIMIS